MFEIAFGGWLFFTIAVLFLVSQAVLLFNNKNGASVGVLAAYAAAMFFLVDEWPTFNYKWLLIYPVLGLFWLGVYWYLDLVRRASRLKSLVIVHGSLAKVYNDYSTNDIVYDRSKNDYFANIKHPKVNDLLSNALLFPISIPLFFGENAVRMTIDYMRQWMEEVRKRLNNSVNNFRP